MVRQFSTDLQLHRAMALEMLRSGQVRSGKYGHTTRCNHNC